MKENEILMNPNKMLKIGNYDIPDNVYKETGIPNEIVNDMITVTVNNDIYGIDKAVSFCMLALLEYPEDADQIDAIIELCERIEADNNK
jgi:hypothetical protein